MKSRIRLRFLWCGGVCGSRVLNVSLGEEVLKLADCGIAFGRRGGGVVPFWERGVWFWVGGYGYGYGWDEVG